MQEPYLDKKLANFPQNNFFLVFARETLLMQLKNADSWSLTKAYAKQRSWAIGKFSYKENYMENLFLNYKQQ